MKMREVMRMKTESHKSMKTDHLIKCHIHVFVFLSLWGLAFSDLTTSQRTRNHGNSLFIQINVRTKVLNSRHPHFSCNMCILVLTIKQAQEDTHTHLNQPSNNAFYQRSAKKDLNLKYLTQPRLRPQWLWPLTLTRAWGLTTVVQDLDLQEQRPAFLGRVKTTKKHRWKFHKFDTLIEINSWLMFGHSGTLMLLWVLTTIIITVLTWL